jgi:hypothetical protein
MIPAVTISIYEDGWEVSTHLQVGMKTFRYYTVILSMLEDASMFLSRWNANWREAAEDYFGYEGIEDLSEPVEQSDVALALARLLPPREPIKRRF